MYCADIVHALKNIKIGPTILFTHLKIILLQCFQFLVFSFSNNKLNPNKPIIYIFCEDFSKIVPNYFTVFLDKVSLY